MAVVRRGRKTVARNELDGMSYKQLLDLEEKIQNAIAVKRDEEKASVKAALADLATKHGFSVDELYGKRGKGKGSAAAKYRNPDNPSETWTGRGRKPNWLVAKLKKGGKIDQFAI